MDLFLALLFGYLLGSVPFGLLLSMAAGKGDVRKIGSGNIGATNVLRTGSKWLAAVTLLLDMGKGFAAVWLAGNIWDPTDPLFHSVLNLQEEAMSLAALGAVLGHCFPIWLKFKGGKGVATNAGVAFGLAWPIGLAYAGVWLVMLAIFRISSVAGMSAVVGAAVAAFFLGALAYVPVLIVIAVLVIWLHRANLKRLIEGTEPRIGSSK